MADKETLLPPSRAGRRLRWLNLGVGLVQHVSAAVMMQQAIDHWKAAPVYTNFPATGEDRTIANMRPVQRHLTGFSVGAMSSAFLFMSGLDHWLVALAFDKTYFRDVKRGRNLFRWTEYFFSASLMHAEIALLCGVFDVHLLFAVYALTAITMVFGALQEVYGNQGPAPAWLTRITCTRAADGSPRDPTPFALGFLPHVANWSIIACYFFRSVKYGSPPDFVWAILPIIFVLDFAFAAVALLHIKHGDRWNIRAEVWYIFLSLTSKQLLAWIQFWGMQGIPDQ